MREVVSLHVGQTGVRVGSALWEVLSREHSVVSTSSENLSSPMFSESESGALRARCVFTDLEPSVVAEVKRGAWDSLYCADCFVTDKEDAASNYSRGHYSVGRGLLDVCTDQIRREVEKCASLQGLLIFSALGGGTGAGFTSLLNYHLRDAYKDKTKLQFSLMPSPNVSSAVVEPYNTVLYMNSDLGYSDSNKMTVLFDNESLYHVCAGWGDVELPSYSDINHVMARIVSSVTSSLRTPGPNTVDLNTLLTNLVPYPRISYVTANLVSVQARESDPHNPLSVADSTASCFDARTSTLSVDRVVGKILSSCLLYQGPVTPGEINSAISRLRSLKTTSWIPCPFKVGILGQPLHLPVYPSVCTLTNHTGLETVVSTVNWKFDALYKRRAFVHHFVGEGLESDEMACAREEMAALERDYMYENGTREEPWYRHRYRGEDEEDSESEDSSLSDQDVVPLVRIRGRGS